MHSKHDASRVDSFSANSGVATTAASTISESAATPGFRTFPVATPPRPTRFTTSRLKAMMVATDTAATALGLVLASVIYGQISNTEINGVLTVAAVSLLLWPILFAQQGLYQARHLTRRIEELRRLVNGVALGVVAAAGVSVLLTAVLPRAWLLVAAVTVFALVGVEREALRNIIRHQRRAGRMSRRVVVVGGNEEAAELASALRASPELGYSVAGWVSDDTVPGGRSGELGDVAYLGRAEDTLDVVRDAEASSVVVATTGVSQDIANRVVRDLTREGFYVELSSSMRDIASRRATVRPLGRYPVVCVEPVTTHGWRPAFKRLFDVVLSLVTLIVTLPITIPAAIAIRVTSGPKVLFRQDRVGRNGKVFTVYKLRTMVHNAEDLLADLMEHNEAAGPMFKMSKDPRVTGVGRFLRMTSIDELPQLLNVLKGDMSLVGPRPALPEEAFRWNDDLRERLRVKPGITGNWQVNGRFTASIEDYQRLDLYYVDNWSIVSDLVILAKTIPAVLRRNGAA